MPQVSDDLARKIFERDKYTCQGCKKVFKSYLDCTGTETTELIKNGGNLLVVDHKDSRSEEESNLQALCFSCNAKKSGRNNRNFKLYTAIKSLGSCMTYYPSLARVLGLKESIFLCQLIYWTPRGRHEKGEGWIYKSAEEMEVETALSYKEQIRLRKQLVNKKLIEENYDRTQHRLYFRVRVEALDLLGEHITNGHIPQITDGQVADDEKSGGTLPKVSSYKGSKDYTETTQLFSPPTSDRPSKPSEKKPFTTFPEGLQPNDSNKTLAQSLGINLREFWPSFRDSCLAKDRKYKDWHAAANQWMRNESKWDKARPNANSGQQQLKAGLW